MTAYGVIIDIMLPSKILILGLFRFRIQGSDKSLMLDRLDFPNNLV